MGFFDRLLGREDDAPPQRAAPRQNAAGTQPPGQLSDEQAVARYRYLLQTAPPEAIEQAHAEAFARLTPEQRRMALQQLSQNIPAQERASSDDPQTLARMATRAEMRQPGFMERTFGGMGAGGMSMGGLLAGGLLASIAGSFVGSAIANQFFDNNPDVVNNYYGDGSDQMADNTDASQELDAGDTAADFDGGSVGGDFGGEI